MFDQLENTKYRIEARRFRVHNLNLQSKKYGIKKTIVQLELDDLRQAQMMLSWDIDVVERDIQSRLRKSQLVLNNSDFEHVNVILDGYGCGSIESYMTYYPQTNFVSYDGCMGGIYKSVNILTDRIHAKSIMRHNKRYGMSLTFVPICRGANKLWTTGDPPSCMTDGFIHMCDEKGIIIADLKCLHQPYEGHFQYWANGQRLTREEITFTVTTRS